MSAPDFMGACIELRYGDAPTLADMLPDALPPVWQRIPPPPMAPAGSRWWRVGHLRVCTSLDHCDGEGLWLHTSVSIPPGRRLPSWADLSMVKEAIHEDRLVVQILPSRREYVNAAEVLHLWERIDQPTLPAALGRASR